MKERSREGDRPEQKDICVPGLSDTVDWLLVFEFLWYWWSNLGPADGKQILYL